MVYPRLLAPVALPLSSDRDLFLFVSILPAPPLAPDRRAGAKGRPAE
jgi:hypothetical protein